VRAVAEAGADLAAGKTALKKVAPTKKGKKLSAAEAAKEADMLAEQDNLEAGKKAGKPQYSKSRHDF
jgi:hypothetical protein